MSGARFRATASRAGQALRGWPILGSVVGRAKRLLWQAELARTRGGGEVTPGPLRLLRPSPWEIRHGLWRLDLLAELGISHQRRLLGLVRGGDWDLDRFEIEDLGIFEAIRQYFVDGVPWAEIPYYREMRRSLEAGVPQFKYRTVEDLPRQWRRMEALFARIKREGILTQHELGTRRPWDEIVVAIDRDGRLLFLNGRHRLAIARVLNLSEVPVLVGVRHRSWIDLVRELETYSTTTPGDPSLPGHPDLTALGWTSADEPNLLAWVAGATEDRFGVLDLDAGLGGRCHRLSEAPVTCTALSTSSRQERLLARLRDARDLRFSIATEMPNTPFHTALALDGLRSLGDDLGPCSRLNAGRLVLGVPTDAPPGLASDERLEQVMRATSLSHARDLAPPPRLERLIVLSRDLHR